MSSVELRSRPVGEWSTHAYVLVCPETNESVLIDPGAEPETLMEMLEGTTPVLLLLTHTHADHVGALDEMLARLDVPLMAHAGPHVNNMQLNALQLEHGDAIQFGKHMLRAFYTPGHTEDMLSFAIENDPRIIVGDTLFAGGPGKTWSPEGFQTTLRTLSDIVLTWPDETICYPGHGPSFRLGDKRADIEAFANRDHAADFYGDAEW